MWAQRAQQMWLLNGDRNTKYFHTVVNSRRNKGRIHMIQTEANTEVATLGKRIIDAFGHMSGLFMNPHKSEVKFSLNCPPTVQNSCANVLQCTIVDKLGKYLGGFIDGPARDRQNFKIILEQVTKHFQGWKAHMLSQAARCTLIQAVLIASSIYYLQFTKLIRKEVAQCNRLLSRFFWGHTQDKPGISMIAWNRICQPKQQGGLGIRRFDPLNRALLGKQYWRILTNQNTLLHRVFRAKYGDPQNPRQFHLPCNASPLWKKIFASSHIITENVTWRVGNGANI
ncbi:ribonuclease H [Senna tora]|uniref:Ribonuclease H n=1 Tax=Senna tora TaxID=362788 RepID=A0A834TQ54_9FABA|nr:ribonuclease H [Senna tora]